MANETEVPAALLFRVPASLISLVENYWHDWQASCQQKDLDTSLNDSMDILGRSWACSDFVARNCIRYPETFLELIEEGIGSTRTVSEYESLVSQAIQSAEDENTLMSLLRRLRQKEMLRIAWRDLNQLATVEQILYELTDLAVAFVSVTLAALENQQAERFGMPLDSEGQQLHLLVFAMGKMGGRELNFSSDIDLIFAYTEDGETTGRRQTSHQEFYRAVISKLVKMLDEVTADGFVYRVDTRLRPFGKSGPVAMSFSGLEQYYQLHGRDWERYAMIKAKLITGRETDKKYLQSMLTPFVYRRYLDFTMIDSIREMKAMIDEQMKRKEMQNNIKLGRGGIREIEFIGQTLQLIRAGREPELRERSIIKVLTLLAEKNYLTQQETEALIAAYWFLRKLENRLQMLGDKQTHVLPVDELSQQRISLAMGFEDWSSLLTELESNQQHVDVVFQNLITKKGENIRSNTSAFTLYWSDAEKHFNDNGEASHNLQQYLQSLGYQQVEAFAAALDDFRHGSVIRNMSGGSARLMAQLMESLVEKIADYPAQLALFTRVIKILKALAGRKVYLSLLNEHPAIQLQMLTLCSTSEWFSERITHHPILLDGLLSSVEVYHQNYDIQQLLDLELKRIASESAETDLELLMERMRQFKRQNVFTIAILDVFYEEAVEAVSDQLTDLANVLLEKILMFSWQAMVEKYGEPSCLVDGERFMPSMGIVAYGKMGGNELGYGSDLDIIFLHDSHGTKQQTSGRDETGKGCIDNQQFFARVAQRVIHFLNTRTYSGILYEADTRLRPDGQSGLMVSSIEAFERYQLDKAWTWEHQALIRARFVTDNVAGKARLGQEFDRIRHSVLQQHRERGELFSDVVSMREKMRKHLSSRSDDNLTEEWDIKQDRGGLVDIEFMTQAGVLLFAERCTDCIRHTATLELINELNLFGFYTTQEAQHLASAYRCFRKMKNWQNLLCDIDVIATSDEINSHRDHVIAVWDRLMPKVSA